MKHLCKRLSIKSLRISFYHPQTNLSERVIQSVESILGVLTHNNKNDWDSYLSSICFVLNTMKRGRTGFSAFKIIFVREPKTVSDVFLKNYKQIELDFEKYDMIQSKILLKIVR